MEYVTCLQCKGNHSKPFVSAQDYQNPTLDLYHVEQCSACGLVFQNPRPLPEELPQYYATESYYAYKEWDDKRLKRRGVLERLRLYLFEKTITFYYGKDRTFLSWIVAAIGKNKFGSAPPGLRPGRILDVGCGDGAFLAIVCKLGWKSYGVEVNKKAAERASKLGIQVHAGDIFSATYPSNYFDLVRIWSVLEHLPKPFETLLEIQRVLKPGGFLILQVPNIESISFALFKEYWSGLDLPRHLTHFSPTTLRRALEENGFKIKKLKFASVGTSLASLENWYRFKKIEEKKDPCWWVSEYNPLLRLVFIVFDRICDQFRKGDCLYVWAQKAV